MYWRDNTYYFKVLRLSDTSYCIKLAATKDNQGGTKTMLSTVAEQRWDQRHTNTDGTKKDYSAFYLNIDLGFNCWSNHEDVIIKLSYCLTAELTL